MCVVGSGSRRWSRGSSRIRIRDMPPPSESHYLLTGVNIELLFDLVSAPIDGKYHSFNDCGWHYSTFDRPLGQAHFRREINQLLKDYHDGWELDRSGELLTLGRAGLRELVTTQLPASIDQANVRARVE